MPFMIRRFGPRAGLIAALLASVAALALPAAAGAAAGQFFEPESSPEAVSPDQPRDLVVADFDEDGFEDLAVLSQYGPPQGENSAAGRVTVLLGTAGGDFEIGTVLVVAEGANAITAGDFDGDGHTDLVVVGTNGPTLAQAWLGDGQGEFPATRQWDPGVGFALDAAPADFDGDGDLDVAMTDFSSDRVRIQENDGDANFTPDGQPEPTGDGPVALAVGQLDGEPGADIATANQGDQPLGPGTPGGFSVLLNEGNLSFSGSSSPLSGDPSAIFAGAIDSAPGADLVIADGAANAIHVLSGSGAGAFTETVDSPLAASSPRGVAVRDLDGDGNRDIAASSDSNAVEIFFGDGGGGFAPSAQNPIATGSSPLGIVIGLFNGPGLPDIATANFNSDDVTVLLNPDNSTPPPVPGECPNPNPASTQAGGPGGDLLTGTESDDLLVGRGGRDRLEGLGGLDCLMGRADGDELLGGDGDDFLAGAGGPDDGRGGTGNDELRGAGGDDFLDGDTGDDRISAGDGSDQPDGGPGADSVRGGKGDDVVIGGPGADNLDCGPGDDRAIRAGADTIARNCERVFSGED